MNIGKMINQRRTELGLTLEEVGNIVGVSKSTVKKWEDGFISNMKRDKIALLAKALRMNPVSFITGEFDIINIKNIEPLPKMKKVPLLGTIACGEPILADENVEDYINMPEATKGTFALRCKGDSMINARIFDGDIVYIREQPEVENGEIAAIIIDNEATLKRVQYFPKKNMIILKPENPKYEDFIYANEELENIKIIGKAVGFYSRVR